MFYDTRPVGVSVCFFILKFRSDTIEPLVLFIFINNVMLDNKLLLWRLITVM